MLKIRPVSDLRNNFTTIEQLVNSGNPVYCTKNGYGTMVVPSLEAYGKLTDDLEMALDAADNFDDYVFNYSLYPNCYGGNKKNYH